MTPTTLANRGQQRPLIGHVLGTGWAPRQGYVMARKAAKRSFGSVRQLRSGSYQARYTGPDSVRYTSLVTYTTKMDAEAWLVDERRKISAGIWESPTRVKPEVSEGPIVVLTFSAYAKTWVEGRLTKGQPLKPRTRHHYAALIATRLEPELGELPLGAITPAIVRDWYGSQDTKAPTMRAHAYALLRTIMGSALEESLIPANPCAIKGAQHTDAVHRASPATLPELEAIVTNLPDKYGVLVLLAAWCALRYGELAELRRSDLDMERAVIHVRRGVVRLTGEVIVGTPKTRAGVRDVAIPPHLVPALQSHLIRHAQDGRDGLLFPSASGANLSPHTFYRHFERACNAAGRPELRVHDLRHTGAVLAAQTGATIAELMSRLGHSTPQAAMRYQHAAAERDQILAARLSAMASGERTPATAHGTP